MAAFPAGWDGRLLVSRTGKSEVGKKKSLDLPRGRIKGWVGFQIVEAFERIKRLSDSWLVEISRERDRWTGIRVSRDDLNRLIITGLINGKGQLFGVKGCPG